ncbi:MAG: DUF3325 domain-containing protein [Pseudomonadota bacterium]
MLELAFAGGVLALHLLGLSSLALAQESHWRKVMGPVRPQVKNRLRWLGWASLTLGLGLVMHGQGPAFGSLLWLLSLPPAAYAVACTLAWRRQWLRPLGAVLGLDTEPLER